MQFDIESLVAWESLLEASKHEYTIDEYLMYKMQLKQAAIGKDPSVVNLGNFRSFFSPRTAEGCKYAERYFRHCADRVLADEWVNAYAIERAKQLRHSTNYADYCFAYILLRVLDEKTLIENENYKYVNHQRSLVAPSMFAAWSIACCRTIQIIPRNP